MSTKTAEAKPFTVRVNRPILLLLGLVGALFFRVGLDAAIYREWLDWHFPPDQPWLTFAFYFFFLGCGGLIALNCLWLLILPPVMLRFDERGVTFGVGFRYRPYFIPWDHVERIGYGMDGNLTTKDQFLAGPMVTFRDHPDVPVVMATSMGLGYAFRRLTLHWAYANRFPWTVVRNGERFRRAPSPAGARPPGELA